MSKNNRQLALSKHQERQVKSIVSSAVRLKGERKEKNTSIADRAVNATQTNDQNIIQMDVIGQGDGDYQREGDEVYATGVNFNLRFQLDTATPKSSTLRVMMVSSDHPLTYWDQDRPTYSGIVSNTFKSKVNKVYYDEIFSLNLVGADNALKTVRKYIPLNGLKMSFSEGGTTPEKNRLFLLLISDRSSQPPRVVGTTQLYYRDH